MGRLIRHRGVQIEPTKNHEIQPNFQGALRCVGHWPILNKTRGTAQRSVAHQGTSSAFGFA